MSLLSNDDSFAHTYIGKFIEINALRCQWNHPSIPELLDVIAYGVPLFMIYGENDTIMPFHQGETICKVLNKENVSLYIIPDASHSPYVENQKEFCHVIKQIVQSTIKKSNTHIGMYDNVKLTLREKLLTRCFGTFSLSDTLQTIQKQYTIFCETLSGKENKNT
jgi:hypothetical protein